jgi:hypothetical protein
VENKTFENWTIKRLQDLYEFYNKKYWRGGLPPCVVTRLVLPGRVRGMCDPRKRHILIDVEAHQSERQIYATILHEMIHISRGRGGHGESFIAEAERLLQMKAPVSGFGPRHPKKIPRCRFPLCRAAAEKQARANFRFCLRVGVYGEPICDRPGCLNILPVPAGRLFPRARFCGRTCREWARAHPGA